MIQYTEMDLVKPGMLLKAVGFRHECNITIGKTYEVVAVEEGIFPSRPFVTVIGNGGKHSTWHLSRFAFLEAKD